MVAAVAAIPGGVRRGNTIEKLKGVFSRSRRNSGAFLRCLRHLGLVCDYQNLSFGIGFLTCHFVFLK